MPPPDPLEWLAALAALLAPPLCVSCRRPPPRAGDPLCPACRAALPWLRDPRCARCGLPAPCGSRCPMAGGAIARAWAPLAFEGPARAIVHALKFRGALGLADLMAAQMVATAPGALLGARAGLALVPVPTPARRRRRRGFDHTGRIAAAIAARTGLPVTRCLKRTGAAPRQRAGAGDGLRTGPARGRAGRRRAHDGGDARGLCAQVAKQRCVGGLSARLRTSVEIGRTGEYLR